MAVLRGQKKPRKTIEQHLAIRVHRKGFSIQCFGLRIVSQGRFVSGQRADREQGVGMVRAQARVAAALTSGYREPRPGRSCPHPDSPVRDCSSTHRVSGFSGAEHAAPDLKKLPIDCLSLPRVVLIAVIVGQVVHGATQRSRVLRTEYAALQL